MIMGARHNEPPAVVRAFLPSGKEVTVSAEQALRCRYRLADAPEATQEEAKPAARPEAAAVRAWALENDVDCPAKGRIPNAVFEAYEQAH